VCSSDLVAGFERGLDVDAAHARSLALAILVCASAGLTAALSRLRTRGARLVVLPEKFTYLGRRAGLAAAVQPLEGPLLAPFAAAARQHGLYLVAGSVWEEVPGERRTYNTSVLFGPDGTRLAATTDYNVLVLWNLRRIREELAALGLDWEMPPHPSSGRAAEAMEPLFKKLLD
jgi:hypothetical protein